MSQVDIQRIAVVNRGEPAVRFIRALREYNVEKGTSIRSVALFTHADEGLLSFEWPMRRPDWVRRWFPVQTGSPSVPTWTTNEFCAV